ncbi:MAG: 4a-hydroxytetrahydrobiopterin dehydratase [Acidimicrobiales bacterium]
MSAGEVLAPEAVDEEIERRGLRWRRDGDMLVTDVRLGSFRAALAYVQSVGELAEAMDHHPDIDIRWRTVTLRVTTHTAGGLTERDLLLATRIDALGDDDGGVATHEA